jgi:uncharacterized OsmC-like protein
MSVSEAIDKLRSSIAADPSKARAKNAPATARLVDGLQCELKGPYGERVLTDMPPAMGGAASGPNPGWLMRGAIASCTATVIAMRAAHDGIELSELEVTVDTDSDLRGILGIDERISAGHQAIRRQETNGSPTASPEALSALVEWGEAHSPVGCTIKDSPACRLEVQVL